MKFPLSMTLSMAAYMLRNRVRPRKEWQRNDAPAGSNPFHVLGQPRGNGNGMHRHPMIGKRFPLVLMLEPLHTCNLTCTGCGRIREYKSSINEMLTLEQCVHAIDECGAPVVSICGGEPLLYPHIGPLVAAAQARNKTVYLCTNAMMLPKKLNLFKPHPRFFINVHLDGMEKSHDIAVEREGVFRLAIEAIKAAKAAGFKVCTNTTVYRETDMGEIEQMFEYLEQFKLDGHTIAPGYGYSAVNDREMFLTRDDVVEKFKDIDRIADRFRLTTTPAYLDFLRGGRDLPCTAWGNPTYNIKGWKGPCYLITDAHHETFEELMTKTPWESYGRGNDPRCEHCMVHCGYEPSAALGINSKAGDLKKLIAWTFK
ncbi:MAG TPA: adenosyl-hopene transferase HpnH [Bryobacteraceae bacterium]|nr:adenosyl-hopene transferase HpnH [Bryobacteraceae bacterium]